jgi:hypothetical protein
MVTCIPLKGGHANVQANPIKVYIINTYEIKIPNGEH